MSDLALPMNGASFQGFVDVHEIGPQGMIVLRGDLASPKVQAAVLDLTGHPVPGLRGANVSGNRGVLWLSPDELGLLVPYGDAGKSVDALNTSLADQHILAADLSDSRAHFQLSGAGVREVIAKLAPVDMSTDALAPGEIRRTRFAQVAAGFWLRDATTAQIFCFRSVAEYMFTLLSTAAQDGTQPGFIRSV